MRTESGPCLCGDPYCPRCFSQPVECICTHPLSEHLDVSGCRHKDTDGFSCACEFIAAECCQCDQPATKFPKGYDEYCDACFALAKFVECGGCGETVAEDDLRRVQTAPQTRSEPAEYDEVCQHCGPSDGEQEPDPDYDEER